MLKFNSYSIKKCITFRLAFFAYLKQFAILDLNVKALQLWIRVCEFGKVHVEIECLCLRTVIVDEVVCL